jgi:hypothetical protein
MELKLNYISSFDLQTVIMINWQFAGSIPNGVIGIFHWHKSSGRTMALGLTQLLTEMSTRNTSGG